MTTSLDEAILPMFLLLIVSGCFLAEGLPSTELKQLGEIVKQLEAKIEKQDGIINELHIKSEAMGRDMSELRTQNSKLVERMDVRCNRTEEAPIAIRGTERAPEDKAARDLPYIMMCAYQALWNTTGIIPYEELTLDYSNCDRPGGGCSAMDIASGTFTAQTGGLYTITYSGRVDLHPSSNLALDLHHNGSKLQES